MYSKKHSQQILEFCNQIAQNKKLETYGTTGKIIGLEAHNPLLWNYLGEANLQSFDGTLSHFRYCK
jgi:hypothetical protein